MNENQSLAPIQSGGALSMLAVIDRAARDPSVDVSKMEQLLALSERIHDREAKALYDQAMNAAQGEMRPISRDCHNPQTRSRYASYEAIDNAIRPIYTNHGFAMSFGSKAAPNGADRVMVTCRISHRGGHAEYVEVEMPADGKGAKGGDVMTKTHAVGSALSYGKRYLVNLIWNLSFGDQDDDGNAAGRVGARQTTSGHHPSNKTPPASNSEAKQATPADVLPKKATEATRKWMLEQLSRFEPEDLMAFAGQKHPFEGTVEDWPLEYVPTNRQQLEAMIREIEQFIGFSQANQDDREEFSEPFWNATITVPRARMKRADYMVNPDTVRSLYIAAKNGDNDARTRLFGLAKEWEPREWEGRDGKMHPPSREDVDCREALDAFLEWSNARKDQAVDEMRTQPDLIL